MSTNDFVQLYGQLAIAAPLLTGAILLAIGLVTYRALSK